MDKACAIYDNEENEWDDEYHYLGCDQDYNENNVILRDPQDPKIRILGQSGRQRLQKLDYLDDVVRFKDQPGLI